MVVALPSVGQLFCLSLLAVSGMLLEKVALLWSAFFFFFLSVPLQGSSAVEKKGRKDGSSPSFALAVLCLRYEVGRLCPSCTECVPRSLPVI